MFFLCPGHVGTRAPAQGVPKRLPTKSKGREEMGGGETGKGFISRRPTWGRQRPSPKSWKCFQVYVKENLGQTLVDKCTQAVKEAHCLGVSHMGSSWFRAVLMARWGSFGQSECIAHGVFCLS